MADTLTQEEIDALREAVKTGEAFAGDEKPREVDAKQVKVVAYDFHKPRIMSVDQLHSLQMMHESMGKLLQSNIFSILKMAVEVKLVAVDEISYGEFILSLSNPTYMALLATKPVVGNVGLEINAPVVLTILDIMLGGSGSEAAAKPKELSYLERRIFRNVIDIIMADVNSSWADVADITYEVADEESNPEYLQLARPETPCLCVSFDVHIGSTSGLLNLCYPFVVLQSAIARSEGFTEKKRKVADGAGAGGGDILKAITVVPLDVRAVVGSTVISANELGMLKVGDVVCLEQRVDSPINVFVGGNHAFTAEIGKHHGKVAIGIVRACGTPTATSIPEKKTG